MKKRVNVDEGISNINTVNDKKKEPISLFIDQMSNSKLTYV